MEMPGRRPQPYISNFPAVERTLGSIVEGLESPLHKAKSEKELSSSLPAEFTFTTGLSLSRSKSKSQEAGLQRAVSASPTDQFDLQCEKDLEDLIEQLQDRPKKRYSSITVPISVKYSTNMSSRPKSPKKGNELAEKQAEQEKMHDDMDQTLLRIREQLGMLTSERVAMENRMDELTTGIKDARIQCYNQCRQRAAASGIRRARSSTYHSPRSQRKAPPKPIPVHSVVHEKQPSSPTLLSPDSIVSNPEYYVPRHRSASSTDSGYGSLNRKSKSTELKSRSSFSSTPNMSSLSQPSECDWLPNAAIPELPESPCFSQPNTPHSSSFSGRIMSNPSLHYSSNTVPKHFRSQSTSISPPMINVTSSPELSIRRRHDSVPTYQLSHRNSMPESVMNKIIEDEVDAVSVSDSLSQASLSQLSSSFMDEGSPKSQGSTVIVRRSSLTGQVEHIRRPRKRNSFNGSTESEKSKPAYRVLNTGYKRNRKNKVILPNSVETTV